MAVRIKDLAQNVSYLSYLPSIKRQFLDLTSVINGNVNLSLKDSKLASACGFSRYIKEWNGQSGGSDGGDNNGNNEVWKEFGLIALKTAGISTVVIGGTALVVPALGFGASGVGAGTIAAAYQSTFLGGTIASGSAFSVLQSVGAAGLAASTKMGVVGVSAALTSGRTLWNKLNDLREKKP